jgi:hypothetical protein
MKGVKNSKVSRIIMKKQVKAKKACVENEDEDECVECMEYRADLQGLKGYEVIKCLKEPDKYHY